MHIPTKKITEYPLFVRAFFWKQKLTYGDVLKPGMLWARSPLVFAALALLYGALNRKSSPLDAALRSLVTVRISQVNHCAFCIDINSATLIKRGVSFEKIEALRDTSQQKPESMKDVVKCGRTHWIDATPLTLRPDFSGYIAQLNHGPRSLRNT